MSGEYKKLYRSRSNRMLGGICGGIGEYLGIDPTLIRVGFVVAALLVCGEACRAVGFALHQAGALGEVVHRNAVLV